MSAAAGYVTQYEARVSPAVREWAEALIERWRVEGRSDLVAEDLMRSLVLDAFVAGEDWEAARQAMRSAA